MKPMLVAFALMSSTLTGCASTQQSPEEPKSEPAVTEPAPAESAPTEPAPVEAPPAEPAAPQG